MGVPRNIRPCRMSEGISEFIDWRRNVRGHAANTCRTSEQSLRRMCGAMKNPMLYNLTRNDVNRYMAKRGQELSPGSANTERAHIRSFLTWCKDESYVVGERNLHRDLRYVRYLRPERQRLTAGQFPALWDTAKCTRDRVLLVALTDTLMRSSELREIRWNQVDLDAGEITFIRWKTKTQAVVPISANLDRELRNYWIWYEQKIGRQIHPEDYLIAGIRVNVWLEPKVDGERKAGDSKSDESVILYPDKPCVMMHPLIQDSLRQVGMEITYQEGGHTLRRSAARELLEAFFQDPELNPDEALLMVMNMLGHSSVDMTMRYIGYNRDRERMIRLLKGKDWWAFARPAGAIPIRAAAGFAPEAASQ